MSGALFTFLIGAAVATTVGVLYFRANLASYRAELQRRERAAEEERAAQQRRAERESLDLVNWDT